MTNKLSLDAAVLRLNNLDDAHWTKSGQANLNVLKELTGRRVRRFEVENVMRSVIPSQTGNPPAQSEDAPPLMGAGINPEDITVRPGAIVKFPAPMTRVAAFANLDPDDDGQWNDDGSPNLAHLTTLTGKEMTADMVPAVINRANAARRAIPTPPGEGVDVGRGRGVPARAKPHRHDPSVDRHDPSVEKMSKEIEALRKAFHALKPYHLKYNNALHALFNQFTGIEGQILHADRQAKSRNKY